MADQEQELKPLSREEEEWLRELWNEEEWKREQMDWERRIWEEEQWRQENG